ADGESARTAAYPRPGAHGVEFRRSGRPGRRVWRRRTPVEAGPHLRRPRHLDRTGRSPSGRQWRWGRGISDVPARRSVGALPPDRRRDPSRQPLDGSRSARPAAAPAHAAEAGSGELGAGTKPAVALLNSPATDVGVPAGALVRRASVTALRK